MGKIIEHSLADPWHGGKNLVKIMSNQVESMTTTSFTHQHNPDINHRDNNL
jgi:hypothetical protein